MPGEWYGPQTILNSIASLNKVLKPVEHFKVIIFTEGNIFLDKIEKQLRKNNSIFIGIPLRLGLKSISSEYLECLKEVFKIK